ncbi:hypothetical protein [Maricaulis sp. W15]|uniref:hypothetical protein n=1 Tax=Maricaulis sp. W15 TaxID=1772333 RepID=UPI00117C980E|nr:hypothetical protein [Maricaulis sp. W15]
MYYIVLSVFGSAIYTDQFPDRTYVKPLLEVSIFYFVYAYPAAFVVYKYNHSLNVKLISFFLSFVFLVDVAARAFVSLAERDDLILLSGLGNLLAFASLFSLLALAADRLHSSHFDGWGEVGRRGPILAFLYVLAGSITYHSLYQERPERVGA